MAAPPAPDSQRIVQQQRLRQLDDFRLAVRALLMAPLMGAQHPDLPLVRRQAEALSDWFQREAGWPLLVERDGARLYKHPADLRDATRGLPRFDRARYALLCLACAVLERAEAQISLRSLGERLLVLAADPALLARGFAFTLQSQSERRDLVAVCQLLMARGVLQRVAGDEDAYVQSPGHSPVQGQAMTRAPGQTPPQADVLYDLQRRSLAGLLAAVRGPSSWPSADAPATLDQRLAALARPSGPDHTEARRTAVRHALAQRLLDDPVVYLDELDEDERAYFINQRGAMAARLADATGLSAEHRAEGSALTDDERTLSDVALPAEGTEAHAALLVAEFLVACGSRSAATTATTAATDTTGPTAPTAQSLASVADFLARARDTHGRYWRLSAREPGSEQALAAAALQRLAQLGLVRLQGDTVQTRSALARYRLVPASDAAAPQQASAPGLAGPLAAPAAPAVPATPAASTTGRQALRRRAGPPKAPAQGRLL